MFFLKTCLESTYILYIHVSYVVSNSFILLHEQGDETDGDGGVFVAVLVTAVDVVAQTIFFFYRIFMCHSSSY